MSAAFGDSLPGASGEGEDESFLEFRDVDSLFLEVWVLSNKPGWVKLGGASAVAVAAANP